MIPWQWLGAWAQVLLHWPALTLARAPDLRKLFPTRVVLPSEEVSAGFVNDSDNPVAVCVQWEWAEMEY